jgi:uncharacterized membrane protein YeiB
MTEEQPERLSPDGHYRWDGNKWQPTAGAGATGHPKGIATIWVVLSLVLCFPVGFVFIFLSRWTKKTKLIVAGVCGALLLLGVISVATAPKTTTNTAVTPSPTALSASAQAAADQASADAAAAAKAAADKAAADKAAADKAAADKAAADKAAADKAAAAAAAPPMTAQQQNAARSAQQYLSISGFSRQGLIDQLSSSAGDGYSVQDATVAVDSLTVNWNAEAVKSAKQYLSISAFSCNGLIQQLDSSAGDKYTVAQATYGAQQAGAC